jgi:hypothetical protein
MYLGTSYFTSNQITSQRDGSISIWINASSSPTHTMRPSSYLARECQRRKHSRYQPQIIPTYFHAYRAATYVSFTSKQLRRVVWCKQ